MKACRRATRADTFTGTRHYKCFFFQRSYLTHGPAGRFTRHSENQYLICYYDWITEQTHTLEQDQDVSEIIDRRSIFWFVWATYAYSMARPNKGSKEMCALLGYYAAYGGNTLPTFQDNLSVPSSRVKNILDLRISDR
jgi:hypothetical protein